ncbi:MAG: lactate dehydrogenase [Lachnospiraceae bacterium]|nr:lactate dehydrogenase [Candidatus Equihabitans merdae]
MAEEACSPLVFLTNRDPLTSRGVTAISQVGELFEEEGIELLKPCKEDSLVSAPNSDKDRETLSQLVSNDGAVLLNTAFGRCYDFLENVMNPKRDGYKVTLVGLGDVGGTVLTGLKLLGNDISEVAVFDPYEPMMARYEIELNQVLPIDDDRSMPVIKIADPDHLFDCDVFIFTASKGVPGLGTTVKDVRMAQYEANRGMLASYAAMARQAHFQGLFCQVSDPVDHLSRGIFLDSQKDQEGHMDFMGLMPEQVQGFGLGVMAARAAYYAKKNEIEFEKGRVYGPHGQGLIAANSFDEDYNNEVSCHLTDLTRTANLKVRDLGFKPYIAPGLSSAAVSILRLMKGQVHYGAVPMGGTYFGCRSRFTSHGISLERENIKDDLMKRIHETYDMLKVFEY